MEHRDDRQTVACDHARRALAERASGVVLDDVRTPTADPLLDELHDPPFMFAPGAHPQLPSLGVSLAEVAQVDPLYPDALVMLGPCRVVSAWPALGSEHLNIVTPVRQGVRD